VSSIPYEKPKRIWIRDHPELNERWLQDRIADDPSLLGLGDLVLRDKERSQPRAGRLDLLLQDVDAAKRYEVEIQLGRTDESHIVRTIEYWDIERKRYPQYDHVGVIVAEDITSRFLNVIALFNGFIPLVAIQLYAIQVGDCVSLVFTKVIDELQLGMADEDEDIQTVTDRQYWEQRGSPKTLAMTDEMLELVRTLDADLELKYNKFYIGLAKDGQPYNFVVFRPKKEWLRIEPRLDRSEEIQALLDQSGLDVMEYDSRWKRYRINLFQGDIEKHYEFLLSMLTRAHDDAS
jgi:hypothetical protein